MNQNCPKCNAADCPHPMDKDGNILEPILTVPCFVCPANQCALYNGFDLCNACDLPQAMLDRYKRTHGDEE